MTKIDVSKIDSRSETHWKPYGENNKLGDGYMSSDVWEVIKELSFN